MEENPTERDAISIGAFAWETFKTILIVGVFSLLIRVFLFQPFIVDGRSMEPNYETSDYLLVDKLTYRFREPNRGEVVVLRPPNNLSDNYIKRVIGLPNERLSIAGGKITVTNQTYPNGKVLEESYLSKKALYDFTKLDQKMEIVLGPDQYFVMGDNRGASTDSRVFGPITRDEVVGRSLFRLFPLGSMKVFAHEPDPLGY